MYYYLWRKKLPIKTLLAADLPSDQLKQKCIGAEPVVATLKRKLGLTSPYYSTKASSPANWWQYWDKQINETENTKFTKRHAK